MSDQPVDAVEANDNVSADQGIMVVWTPGAIWNRRVLTADDLKTIAGPKSTKTKTPLVWESENLHRLLIEEPNDLLLEFFQKSDEFEIK